MLGFYLLSDTYLIILPFLEGGYDFRCSLVVLYLFVSGNISHLLPKKRSCSPFYKFLVHQSIFKLNKYRRLILNFPIDSYRPMQDGVPSQPHLMEQTDRNYQFYSGVERGMLPPQENIVTHNYSSGPSAPYVPPVQQQYASEAVMQQGTSSMSFERSLIRRFG